MSLGYGPLRGRDTELDVLHERVRALSEGRGGVVLLEGAAGAGKSRFVFDAVVAATGLGVSVATASAADATALGPLAPLLAALPITTTMPPDPAVNGQLWLVEQLRAELEQRTSVAPLLVAIDDLDSADLAALQTLQTLQRDLEGDAVLWLLAGRDTAVGAPVSRLFRALEGVGAVVIDLAPLFPGAVAAVIADAVGAEPDDELRAIAAGAGGNPALLVELVEGLADEGAVDVVEGVAHLKSGRLPARLQDVVAHRLERLPSDAVQLLEVAAVLGRTFSVEDVAQVLGLPVGALLAPLEGARNAGVIQSMAGSLSFRHDLVRWALYESIPKPVRLALHRQVAGMFLARGDSPVAAAGHLREAGGAGDHDALAALDDATAELLAGSPNTAADLALQTLELTDPTDDTRFDRAANAVTALVAGRRLSEASELASATLAHRGVPPEATARLRLTRSSIALMRGATAECVDHAEAVLDLDGVADAFYGEAEVARLLGVLTLGDFRRARQLAESILAGVERSSGPGALVAAITALSFIAWQEGRVRDALGFLRAAVRRSERGARESYRIHPRLTLAALLATIGDFEEASDLVAQVRDDVSALGESEWSPAVALTGARVHLAAGHMDAAAAEAEAGLALAKALGTSVVEPLGHWVLASVALLGGDLTETGNRVAAYRAALPPLANAVGSASYLLIEARLSEAQHGPEGAVALLQPVYDDLRAHRLELVIDPTMAASLARNAVAVGAHETADAVVADAEAIAADNPGVACLSAAAAQARGIAARDVVSLDEAAVRHRHPWARASALEDGGGLLAASDRTAARVHFQRGLDGYEHVAADRDAERMRSRLRRLDRKHRRSDPRPVEGWGSLTDNERRVSHLVAQGLTNSQTAERMFLSRHTIDFHLRQIFRKLSISSRVELARIAITRERR